MKRPLFARAVALSSLLGALGLSPACKKKAPGVEILRPGELEQMEASLTAELRKNQARSCPRPPLRGQAAPGRADDDLALLLTGAGDLEACATAARDAKRALLGALHVSSPPRGWPARALPVASPLARAAETPRIDKVAAACHSLPPAIERAVAHFDACSPYLPGRREQPVRLTRFIDLGRAVALLARRRARRSPLMAARLLLDWLRVGQDLCRGGTHWIPPLMTSTGLKDVAPSLELILAHRALSRKDLKALGKELALLAAAEPKISDIFRGDRQLAELDFGLREIKGARWRLAGTERSDLLQSHAPPKRRPGLLLFKPKLLTGSNRVDKALAWIAIRTSSRPREAACARTNTPFDCSRAVEAALAKLEKRGQTLAAAPAKGPRSLRRRIVAILAGIGAPSLSRSIRRASQRAFLIGAMRLHVAVRLLALRLGKAPKVAEVARLPEAQREPFAGKPFRLTTAPPGLVVAASERLSKRDPFTYLIRLP